MPETKDKTDQSPATKTERDARYRDKDRPRSRPEAEEPVRITDWASI